MLHMWQYHFLTGPRTQETIRSQKPEETCKHYFHTFLEMLGNLAFYVPFKLQLAHEGDVEMPLVNSKTPLTSANRNISLTRAIDRLVRVRQTIVQKHPMNWPKQGNMKNND